MMICGFTAALTLASASRVAAAAAVSVMDSDLEV